MTRTVRTALMGTVTATALFAFANPASAQSTCSFNGTIGLGADCTSPNGNGSSYFDFGSGLTLNFADPTAVLVYTDQPTDGATTGYIESTTAGMGVIHAFSTTDINYDGSASTLVGSAAATGATILQLEGTSVTASTGNITADGAGSTGVLVTSTGGAGSGGIDLTVDGTIQAVGSGVVVNQSNAAADGAVQVTVNSGEGVFVDGGNGIDVNSAGAGNVTVTNDGTVGSYLAPNSIATAIQATSTGTGDVTVNGAGSVGSSTDRAGVGINADIANAASAGDVMVDLTGAGGIWAMGDSIDATTSGTGTVTVSSASPLDSMAGNGITASSTTGGQTITAGGAINAGNIGISATSTDGNIGISNTAAIMSAGNGIDAQATGTGAVTVTRTGGALLTSTGGNGIDVSTTSGAINVTSGAVSAGAGDAIVTASTTGNQVIGVTGNLTGGTDGVHATSTSGTLGVTLSNGADITSSDDGVEVQSAGAKTVTIGTGSVVTADYGVYGHGGSTLTVNNAGTLGQIAGAAVLTDLATSAAITNQAGATMNGYVDLSDGADTVVNAGTWNAAGVNAFYGGTDSVTNQAGASLNVAAGTSFTGLETLANAGTLTAANGITFDAGNTALTNSGTLNLAGTVDFLGGTDSLTNTGTLNLTGNTALLGLETANLGGTTNLGAYTLTGSGALVNSGTLNSNGGSLLGFTSQSNSGTLNLSGTTTVAAVPFTNSGTINAVNGAATLTGQTAFTNTGLINLVDGAADDTLTINSSFAGGAGSRLAVDAADDMADMLVITGAITGSTMVDANIIGTGALIAGGVQVVDGQSTSTDNAFVIGTVTGGSPLVAYSVDQTGSDYFLTAALTPTGFEPLSIATMVPDLWYPSADEVIANLAVPYKGEGLGVWAQGYASRDKYGDREMSQTIAGTDYTVNQQVKAGRLGVQAGVDFGMGGTGRVGVTGGFGTHRFKGLTELDADGWNLGAYGAFGGVTGFHGELLAKYDRYRVKFRDGPLDDMSTKVRSTGIDGSVGYRMPMGSAENASLDFAVGLSHVWNKIDSFDAYGLTYDYDGADSTRGRASARWNVGGEIQPYVQGTVYHEFADAGTVVLNDGVNNFALDAYKRGTWGRIEAGVGGSPSRYPSFGAWADVGDVKGIGARLGFRFGGRADAPPPPAPVVAPPAPEPAPATQTCYDGSVILATDTCPVPPPPPPPAATPERG